MRYAARQRQRLHGAVGLKHGVDTLTEEANVYAGRPVNLSTRSDMKSALDTLIEQLEAGTWTPSDAAPNRDNADSLAACGSPDCGGCYVVDVESGAKIHPPKSSPEWLFWLERWKPTGKLQ